MSTRPTPSEPVRLYVGDDARLPRRLSHFLQEEIERLSAEVLNGQLTPENYRFYTGRISGLRMALDEAERISEELS